jgi:predicted NUDIX family NTP pyrophosphohydrolase
VLLAHPGGPFWRRRDLGAWTLPKGEIGDGEEPLAAARREFTEETGLVADGPLIALTPLRQPGGKTVHAWAVEGDCDASALRSNLFSMEWPPKSGKLEEFPEIDRAGWFGVPEARERILKGQAPFLVELAALVK